MAIFLFALYQCFNINYMNPEENKPIEEQGSSLAAQRLHDKLLRKIGQVRGYWNPAEDYDLYPVKSWSENLLSQEDVDLIFERGRSDEIIPMIHAYAKVAKVRGKGPLFPEAMQLSLAQRNVPEEIHAYLEYQGFCETALAKYLEVATPDQNDVLYYVTRHGLPLKYQLWLLQHGTEESLRVHVRLHGLDENLQMLILEELEKGEGDEELFCLIADEHDFCVRGQIKMLAFLPNKLFMYHIQRRGFWKEAHNTLVCLRSDEEIGEYLKFHHFLAPEAEKLLADKKVGWLNKLYIDEFPTDRGDTKFLSALLSVDELDFPAIEAFFEKGFPVPTHQWNEDDKDKEVIETGSHKDILVRIKRGGTFTYDNLVELFLHDKEAFEIYVRSCDSFYYH